MNLLVYFGRGSNPRSRAEKSVVLHTDLPGLKQPYWCRFYVTYIQDVIHTRIDKPSVRPSEMTFGRDKNINFKY